MGSTECGTVSLGYGDESGIRALWMDLRNTNTYESSVKDILYDVI